MRFLNLVFIPQLTEEQSRDCEFILSEKNILLVLKSIQNNSTRFSDRIFKSLLCQVLNEHLLKMNSVIPKSKRK